ncbi:MAG: thermosome subunit beta [Candidatus Parvarchaeota archaeon]|nr:thermosome subunit beta [Candidatus Jingweiarchaeum tengchongense]MCW1298452.1 thermosome subunit beta [Candidatus Jingweiarchaeum tengchongense]MCW1300544.1 thermosome subunit beta [Candidatus Jingweiarchaeum tengchongense]MCW1304981.1 thermosome subunit beta [Candidatus Jingweiarchaeum tengchongense]MCW1309755.1 thermosome subunit beta [Candidatus Jingweiarchaeum tengchongense]
MAEKTTPILILPEGYQRTIGRDAQRTNIMAARVAAETVRTTLGPKGMDKMLVDSLGDVVITNDGVTILEEMEIEHPAAKMMVEIAKTQEEEVGDGTTTAVILAGELLKNAETLLDQEIHPTVIAKGYKLAADKAEEVLNNIAVTIKGKEEEEIIKAIVRTAITGKGSQTARETLVNILTKAAEQVKEESEGKPFLDLDNIKLQKKIGGSVDDTELVEGVVIDKERVHGGMPRIVEDAKIALLDAALEIEKTEVDAQIRIERPEQLESFIAEEEKMLKEMVEKVKKSGANVLFCQKGIDEVAQHFLAKAGIFAVRRVSESDMKKLAKATGARIVSSLDDLSAKDLGYAKVVEEKKIAGESLTFVKKCKNPKAVTILIRGGTEHVVDEAERAIKDALGDLKAVIEDGKVVAGGGAPEIEVAKELRKYAETLSGREQFAVKAFADSMEIIPKTLAENAGLDPIDMLVEIKAKHEKGEKWAGIDVNGKVSDMWKLGVIEPLKVKIQAVKSASEAAVMILRIDDVIAAGKVKESGKMPSGPGSMPPEGEY